jgi:hypothetical protein
MGTDSMTLGPGTLYLDDTKIGPAVFGPNDEDFDFTETIDSPDFTLSSPKSFSCELEASLEDINIPILKELSTTKTEPFYMTHDGVRYEQIRKHKKKRINKKWAKRYGYRKIPVRYYYEHCYISPQPFNDFAITCNRIRMEDV